MTEIMQGGGGVNPGSEAQVQRKSRKVKWWRPWKDQENIINNPQRELWGIIDPGLPAHFKIRDLDDLGFQWQVTFVAGAGFFVDGYLLFANNFALPILGYLYWNRDTISDHETAINCATLSGTILGQIVLGILADKVGRKKVYGWELLIIIVSSVAITMASEGKGSMRISPWLIFWRFVIGFGVGAEYPITAVMTSEWAPTRMRGHMLATVFSAQSLGQFFAALVTYLALVCNMQFDSIWRLLYGLGAVPAVVALIFRWTIPESPRYTSDVERNPNKANQAIEGLGKQPSGGDVKQSEGVAPVTNKANQAIEGLEEQPSGGDVQQSEGVAPVTNKANQAIEGLEEQPSGGDVQQSEGVAPVTNMPHPEEDHHTDGSLHSNTNIQPDLRPDAEGSAPAQGSDQDEEAPNQVAQRYKFPPRASFDDFMFYFWNEGNWKHLVATAGTWFLLDLAFFGLGLNSPQIVTGVWKGCNSTTHDTANLTEFKWNSEPGVTPSDPGFAINGTSPGSSVTFQQMLEDNESGFMVVVSITAILGSFLLIWFVNALYRKTILIGGFVILSILFFILGGIFLNRVNFYDDRHYKGVYIAINVFYAFCQFFFNLGPNGLTFVFPAEIFPTRYRCSCHGVSAAAGKLGSVVAQLVLIKVQFSPLSGCLKGPDKGLGTVLVVFGVVFLFAALLACLLPQVQSKPTENKTLEELSEGRHPEKRKEREESEENGADIIRWEKRDLLPWYVLGNLRSRRRNSRITDPEIHMQPISGAPGTPL